MNALLDSLGFDDLDSFDATTDDPPDFFGGESNIDLEEPKPTPLALAKLRPDADLGYPPSLPLELALNPTRMDVIRTAYGLSEDDFIDLMANPSFVSDLKAARELAKEEGMSFRLKARHQAEEMLKTSWALVHDRETPSSVRADLIKWTARVANLEPAKEQQNPLGNVGGLNIQINLG